MNGISALALKIVAAAAMLFVSYAIGQGSLENRVIVLETQFTQIKETMDKIYDEVREAH